MIVFPVIVHLAVGFSLGGLIGQGKPPSEFNQDRHFIGDRLVIVADGHGKEGEQTAQEVVDFVKGLHLPFEKEQFHSIIMEAIFAKWHSLPKEGGTTLTVVLFNEDNTRALCFTLGDSPAIFNLPKDFEGDASPLVCGAHYSLQAQRWTTEGQPGWWYDKVGRQPKDIGVPGLRFTPVRVRINAENLGCIGIQLFAYRAEDDHEGFIRQVAKTYEVELLPNTRHVIGSDGMPIHKPAFWKAVNAGEDMVAWMKKSYPSERDDMTMVIFE